MNSTGFINEFINICVCLYVLDENSTNEYTFPIIAHGSLTKKKKKKKIDHMLEHKTNFRKIFKKIINPCILQDHYAIKLKIDSKQNSSECIISGVKLSNEWIYY